MATLGEMFSGLLKEAGYHFKEVKTLEKPSSRL